MSAFGGKADIARLGLLSRTTAPSRSAVGGIRDITAASRDVSCGPISPSLTRLGLQRRILFTAARDLHNG